MFRVRHLQTFKQIFKSIPYCIIIFHLYAVRTKVGTTAGVPDQHHHRLLATYYHLSASQNTRLNFALCAIQHMDFFWDLQLRILHRTSLHNKLQLNKTHSLDSWSRQSNCRSRCDRHTPVCCGCRGRGCRRIGLGSLEGCFYIRLITAVNDLHIHAYTHTHTYITYIQNSHYREYISRTCSVRFTCTRYMPYTYTHFIFTMHSMKTLQVTENSF